jgi:predicted metal-dependent enzyme (double-stranded beta helix superfamily)
VVSFVWGPGQGTPIHDHRVWGLVGVLRGRSVRAFRADQDGALHSVGTSVLHPGDIELLSPQDGDIHRVTNGLADGPSISIHVYGANIGAVARATYDLDGREKRFISGYANARLPNLWKRSDNR